MTPASEPSPPILNALVIDDERNIRHALRACLELDRCRVAEAAGAAEALAACAEGRLDLILVDLKLDGSTGLDLIAPLRAQHPNAELVMMTAYGTIESAVTAMRSGANDYLLKPFSPRQVTHLVERARMRLEQAHRVAGLQSRLRQETPDALLSTESPSMRSVLASLTAVADHDVAVLMRGENGTGKTLLARLLHERSRRRAGPFVVINCPTLSEELLASELFGHVRGAFTGAVQTQVGKVEAAEGGTLFLDEVGEISPAMQAKLLRFVQERRFERIGETRTREADVRVVSATNRDVDADVIAGRFRQDLFYRLNTVEILVPPLRDRREDVPGLARAFAEFSARAAARPTPALSRETVALLAAYDWPGNVRELRNAIERALIFSSGETIEAASLPQRIAMRRAGPWLGGDYTALEVEQAHIERVLARYPTQEAAARVLGLDPSTLWRRRKRQSAGTADPGDPAPAREPSD